MSTAGFVPPPYPYDRLDRFKPLAATHDGGMVDLSIGTPCDPPSAAVVAALSTSNAERGYPPSIGTDAFRVAAQQWILRRFGLTVSTDHLAACVGTKEFVATSAQYLRLRQPHLDTILYPEISYPTYAMGATLGGCRAVAVRTNAAGGLDLDSIPEGDASRSLALWINSPSNPTGHVDDLGASAAWGRARNVPVFSDECYTEFTWSDSPRTIIEHGLEGVIAVHSLSKRSNLAGLRVGFYVGDPQLVEYLKEIRKHVGLLVPGPAQAAGAVALGEDELVLAQRDRYWQRLIRMRNVLSEWGQLEIALPDGGFYLWFDAVDGWAFSERLAREGGALVSPGDFYGAGGAQNVRVAVVQPMDRIEMVAKRLGVR